MAPNGPHAVLAPRTFAQLQARRARAEAVVLQSTLADLRAALSSPVPAVALQSRDLADHARHAADRIYLLLIAAEGDGHALGA